MKLCEAKGCEAQLTRAKYCNKHRLRFLRHGDPNYRVKVAKGEWDGYHITLRTGDHRDSHCDNKVYLDNSVINSFWEFCKKHLEKRGD